MRASLNKLVINYLSAMAVIVIVYLYYQFNPHYQHFFSSTHTWPWFSISDQDLFLYGLLAFAVLLPPYFATFPDSYDTKSFLVWRSLFNLRKRWPNHEERVALLATAVKAFFLPLMAAWFFSNGASFLKHALAFSDRDNFFPHGYWALFNFILLVDVAIFVIAYSIEHPKLKNEIKSVEPTLLGWVVALICYPPFNGMTNQMLGWYSSDYPEIRTLWLQYVSGGIILVLMTIYLWASLALNIKASNLTNRGIVSSGPYAYMRHPAYVCKNLAWWVGALPILLVHFNRGPGDFLFAVFCVGAWSFIYYLRAITEERHLMADPDYQAYAERVPGFLPRFR
jgi:protein-S-isoprenylcysteine O-methyltransferase Ste14